MSKFTQADNMGFGIRVETLHALLDTIGDLDRTVFQVQCGSCEELIAQEEEYCPSCGDKLPEGVSEEREQSPLGGVCRIGHRTDGARRRSNRASNLTLACVCCNQKKQHAALKNFWPKIENA